MVGITHILCTMKKSYKIVIGLVVISALIMAGIALFSPTILKDLTSGTYGKADKYMKSPITESDVKLRSEFTSDTVKLKGMIQGLIYFSSFTNDLCTKIDSCLVLYRQNGMCGNDPECNVLKPLKDYSEFIRNNNKTLGATISMLTGFYRNDTVSESADVEKNLREFGNYVSNLIVKDSVLEVSLKKMDNFLLKNKTVPGRERALASLKSIRDQLILSGIQMAALIRQKDKVAELIQYAVTSEGDLREIGYIACGVYGVEQGQNSSCYTPGIIPILQVAGELQGQAGVTGVEQLQTLLNQTEIYVAEELQEVISAQGVPERVMIKSSEDDVAFRAVVYEGGGFRYVESPGIVELLESQFFQQLQIVATVTSEGVGVFLSIPVYWSVFENVPAYNDFEIAAIRSQMDVQAIGIFGENFVGLVNDLQSVNYIESMPESF